MTLISSWHQLCSCCPFCIVESFAFDILKIQFQIFDFVAKLLGGQCALPQAPNAFN